MKRTFLKVLPFAAALLLATSCSKDDNNSTDEIVNNGGEQIETVVKTFKTLTVKGKVNKSISKVTTNQDENALAFEGNEVFAFGSNTDDVYGTINFTNTDGSYTATINYTDESKLLTESFSASLGTNSATISAAYDDLATAVKNAYYTIVFTISQEGDVYKLKSGETDLVVNLQSAFIQALCAKTTQLGGTDFTVETGKYYVVPVGQTMGETENKTVAGQIYRISPVVTINGAPSSKVWGNAAFDVTVTVEPSDATNYTVDWSKSTNVKVTDKGNGTYSVLITGNTGGKATLIATVDGVSSTAAEISVDANYVDLGTGVYWKTSDEGTYTFYNLPSGTPDKEQFSKLWDGTVTVSGTTFTNKNGSGASITLTSGEYWSSTPSHGDYGWCVYVLSGWSSWDGRNKANDKRVRLVCAAQ